MNFSKENTVIVPALPVATATGTITSDNTNNSVADTVTIGSKTYTFNTGVTGTAATGTLTSNNTNVSDGDTVTIGTVVYRFKNTIAQIGDIHIGGTADLSLTNLAAAINGTGTPGTDYFTGTPIDANVSSSAVAVHVLTLTDKVVGAAGNAVATTKVAVTLTWGAVTLTGGIDIINSILIGASADASLTNLAAAVNGTAGAGTTYGTGTVANTQAISSAVAAHVLTISAITPGAAGDTIALAKVATHLSVSDSSLDGGAGGAMTAIHIDKNQTTEWMDVGNMTEAIVFINSTAHAGSSPTLDCKIQYSPDKLNWADSGDTTTQITTADTLTFKKLTANFGKYIRLAFTVGGTTPDYTASVFVVAKG